jgi:hypothetical protein
MVITSKHTVLDAYIEALQAGATTHEEAVAQAAQRTCLPEEAVLEAVWQSDAEVSL